MQEGLTWLMVALVVSSYITQRRAATRTRRPADPVHLDAQYEVDPTRWEHDGTQPAHYGDFDGNRWHQLDAEVLALRNALAF